MELRNLFVLAMSGALLTSTTSFGAFNLQITEIWPGQSADDITEDWIEVTNTGDMAWTLSDGALFVEDGSGSGGFSSAAREVAGLSSINPGQSAIILFEGTATDAADFPGIWDTYGILVGYAEGGGIGLGGGGETAYLFLGDGIGGGSELDSEEYPDTESSPMFIESEIQTESWDVTLRAWSTVGNASGAFESLALGGGDEGDPEAMPPVPPIPNAFSAIGSPGGPQQQVPEPSTIALAIAGALGVLAVRRR